MLPWSYNCFEYFLIILIQPNLYVILEEIQICFVSGKSSVQKNVWKYEGNKLRPGRIKEDSFTI